MTKLKLLLTGGSGMVGRNFLEHPRIVDFEVFAPPRSELDLSDYRSIQAYLEHHKPDLVIHSAGKVGGIQANIREPVAFLRDNLDMGRNIVCASRQAGITRLINLGSSCMYPRDHTGQLREEMLLTGELEPTNEGYALAKIVTARLCEYVMREDRDFQYKTLIPCNLYGRYDNFDPDNSHLVPAIISKICLAKKEGLSSVEIWGDGTARREFMYAGDLADLLVRAIHEFDSLPDLMNVGLGRDYTINEYYQVVADILNYEGEFNRDLSKPVGMNRKLLDIEKQLVWGWNYTHELADGIEKTVEYYLRERK